MATERALQLVSGPVKADYSAKQYYCMAINSSGHWTLLASKGGYVGGVLQNKPAAKGRAGAFAIGGETKVVAASSAAGAGISVGNGLITNASGALIKSSTGGTAYVFARALEARSTGVAAGLISVLITNEGPTSTA